MKDAVCFSEVAEKVYYAKRFPYGVRVDVYGDGFIYPLSVSGDFDWDWGCNNRYSLSFAKAILTDFAGKEIADIHAKDFNDDFISCMPAEGFTIPSEAIKEWIEANARLIAAAPDMYEKARSQ